MRAGCSINSEEGNRGPNPTADEQAGGPPWGDGEETVHLCGVCRNSGEFVLNTSLLCPKCPLQFPPAGQALLPTPGTPAPGPGRERGNLCCLRSLCGSWSRPSPFTPRLSERGAPGLSFEKETNVPQMAAFRPSHHCRLSCPLLAVPSERARGGGCYASHLGSLRAFTSRSWVHSLRGPLRFADSGNRTPGSNSRFATSCCVLAG